MLVRIVHVSRYNTYGLGDFGSERKSEFDGVETKAISVEFSKFQILTTYNDSPVKMIIQNLIPCLGRRP